MVQPTVFQDVITIGLWRFNDPAHMPAGVTQLGVNILDGWDDTAPVELRSSSRGTRDGDILADRFPLRARHIALSGWMYCTSRVAARQAHTAMVRDAFPRNTDLTLVRYEPDVAKKITVRRLGPVQLPALTNLTGPQFRFAVDLIAADPLKYVTAADMVGTAGVVGISTGGITFAVTFPFTFSLGAGEGALVSCANVGDADTMPVVTITGPLPTGWRLENSTTGMFLSMDVSLSASDSLVLDFVHQTAMLNSSLVVPAITGDWFTLPPGVSVVRLFGTYDPSADFTVVASSAWE